MISVLTLTYQRYEFLEEAIFSFLSQDFENKEMVIINDCVTVDYVYEHPQVKIFNLKERFNSISEKLKWGFSKCSFDYIYRLDDDDLLAPNALSLTKNDIEKYPGFDVYRSNSQYYFDNNRFVKISSNVNNGNVYRKKYIESIEFPKKSFGEDVEITYNKKAKIYEARRKPTMIYRWGMNTYHTSGFGDNSNKVLKDKIEKYLKKENGTIQLEPKFLQNYYSVLR